MGFYLFVKYLIFRNYTYEKVDGGYHKEDGILISKKHVLIGANAMCHYLGELKRVYVKVLSGHEHAKGLLIYDFHHKDPIVLLRLMMICSH